MATVTYDQVNSEQFNNPYAARPADTNVGVQDPNLTENVFPNILDDYDLPQYTLKLSLYEKNDRRTNNERIVAQSSVTATQIDDLVIHTLASGATGGEVTFRLVQPGHATLLDEINKFRVDLGLDLSVRPIMFLEVNFKGYSTSSDSDNEISEPVTIAGPYVYKLFIADVKIKIDEKGSEYDVKGIIHNFYANTNSVAEIPALTVTNGGSVRAICAALEKAIREYYFKEKPEYHIQDEYKFDLDHPSLSKGFDGNIADKALKADAGDALDSDNTDLQGEGLEERKEIQGDNGIEVEGNSIKFRSGVKMEQFFLVLLSMNEEFKKKISRRADGSDPKSAPRPEQTFIKWFRVITDAEEIGFDHYRQEYARRYIYKLVILDTARTDVGPPDEKPNPEQVVNRFKDIKERKLLRKAYYYIFTGRNDQIVNLDLDFQAGAVVFNPPGIDIGNPKEALKAQINAIPPDIQGQQRKDYEETINARADYIQSGAAGGGVWDKVKGVFVDTKAEKFNELRQAYEEKYKTSFLVYGSKETTLSLQRQSVSSLANPDFVQNGTYFGFSNTLFAFKAYQYHIASLGSSLVRLNMTVRGDPWFLGKRIWAGQVTNEEDYKKAILEKRPELGEPDPYSNKLEGCFYGDHTFFYLQFMSPRINMNNYDDEDDDDGYWKFDQVNGTVTQSFSGIYLILGVTNKFSDGVFTSELDASLMSELLVSEIKKDMPQPDTGTK